MNTRKHESRRRRFALAPLALALAWAGAAEAAEYWLCAKTTSLTMPDSQVIPMWGFAGGNASDGITSLDGACAAAASVPGPDLVVPPGDNSLTVHLRNALTGLGVEPVSVVIPGQAMPATSPGASSPVKFTDGSGRQRVRSFTAEASAGADQAYAWNALKPGTYLYHSGTHPQVQVQMGLYGAVKHDAASGQAYAGVPYSSEATLLFSEIDPALHTAVAAGQYGPAGTMTSTIDYLPSYFLVNGAPYVDGVTPDIAAGSAGQPTLLRLLNAGLQSRAPLLQGAHMQLIAEDGNPYPHAREQYSALLPALKTIDALVTPSAAATYAFYDRRLALSNPGATGAGPGGMLAFLTVGGAPGGTPTADNDAYATSEDTALNIAAPGVLDGDSAGTTASLLSGTTHGSLNLAADGSFTYTPQANYNGADSFTYRALSGGVGSAPATVSLTINPVNDPPVASGEAYSVPAGTTLNVAAPGVLGNDSDVDGNLLTAVNASALSSLALNANGSFSYGASTAGNYSFTYQAFDGTTNSSAATVNITVVPNQPPVAVNDSASAARRAAAAYTPVVIAVLANDSDPNNNIAPATVSVPTNPKQGGPNKGGTVSVNANGSISYTPRQSFRGTETFSYRVQDTGGLWSNTATVRVNVQ